MHVAQTCATNEAQRIDKTVQDQLQALATTVEKQCFAIREQAASNGMCTGPQKWTSWPATWNSK